MSMNDLLRPRRPREKGYDDLVKVIKRRRESGEAPIVYPGKGLTSTEIRSRIRNKSIIPGTGGLGYSEEKGITEIMGMSRIDLMRSHANEKPRLAEKEAEINAMQGRSRKTAELRAAEAKKGGEDGKQ